jgi:hypothetical protein
MSKNIKLRGEMGMKKLRRLGVAILAASLVLGLGTAASAKGPQNVKAEKEVKEVQTGRTAQAREVDAITVYGVETATRGALSVPLYGTVVIDGPELHLTINGVIVEAVKVGDKTWEYEINGQLTKMDDDNNAVFTIEAHTFYSGGQPYMQVHTSATSVIKKVHVPFVTETTAENPRWGNYDAETNTFPLTYDLRKVWSDGGEDEVDFDTTVSVDADLEFYNVPGTDSYFEVPEKPEVISSQITNIEVIFDSQNTNRYKVKVSYEILFANGETSDLITTGYLAGTIDKQNETKEYTLVDEETGLSISFIVKIVNGNVTVEDEEGNTLLTNLNR